MLKFDCPLPPINDHEDSTVLKIQKHENQHIQNTLDTRKMKLGNHPNLFCILVCSIFFIFYFLLNKLCKQKMNKFHLVYINFQNFVANPKIQQFLK